MAQPQLFVLGRTPNLSAAEISAVVRRERSRLSSTIPAQGAVILREPLGDPAVLIRRLGGTVKIGTVAKQVPPMEGEALAAAVAEVVFQTAQGTKRVFGVSFLSDQHHQRVKRLGVAVKRLLSAKGLRTRYIVGGDQPALSSVTVKREGLLENGAEILIARTETGLALARTDVVQPFEELSKRDYGRPSRDVIAGMLPPKLAMMLVNLASLQPEQTLLDPFCGSGTILQEAELLGIRSLVGSDANGEAVAATRENLKWLLEHESIDRTGITLTLKTAPVAELPRLFGSASVDAIVTEPFLGPPLRRSTHPGVISQAVKDASVLYDKFVATAKTLLKPGGRLAMVVPMFRTGKQSFREPHFRSDGFGPVDLLPAAWGFDRRLIYGRPDQHVFRKIFVLRKS